MAMVLPAIAVSPKLFTDARTKMLAKQNTAPCTVDGIPVFRMLPTMRGDNLGLRNVSRKILSFARRRSTTNAESIVEISVAMAPL